MAREWWLSDHNGEEPRAREWGESLVLRPGLAPVAVTHTAMSFGDTGLVACLLSVALATRALERGYALTDRALCFGAGDDGSRGLLEVERHP
jgi:3-oxoacyl-[acyl-carrier-protein] synthase-1